MARTTPKDEHYRVLFADLQATHQKLTDTSRKFADTMNGIPPGLPAEDTSCRILSILFDFLQAREALQSKAGQLNRFLIENLARLDPPDAGSAKGRPG
jgi:hypothetical protein